MESLEGNDDGLDWDEKNEEEVEEEGFVMTQGAGQQRLLFRMECFGKLR